MAGKDEDISERDMQFLDRVAALSVAGDDAFDELRGIYESDERLRVPIGSPILS